MIIVSGKHWKNWNDMIWALRAYIIQTDCINKAEQSVRKLQRARNIIRVNWKYHFLPLYCMKFKLRSEQHICMFVLIIIFEHLQVDFVFHISTIIGASISIFVNLHAVYILEIFTFWENFHFFLKNPISPQSWNFRRMTIRPYNVT